ncbi:wolframin-like isoform X2 [Drosophila hydei]|uniref:Wolframin-like isoform X2 n=1 Tax=Drosophila hydei TaxID=7224 RepID=A0A6J2SWY0_DROHY|nr:wolframin-like isoform X2 [Drosophila hydei]
MGNVRRASLNKLKEYIAEEGYPQVLFDLGRKLLDNAIALYLRIPILLVLRTKRSNWYSVYSYLIPHCVSLSCIVTS